MVMRILVGVSIGTIAGCAMGYFGKCSSGACPLTSTPARGAFYGAFWGLMLCLL